MPWCDRRLITDKALAAVLAVALVVVVGGTTAMVSVIERTAAEAAALEAAKASSDLRQARDADTDPVLLEAWAACRDPAVRRAVAGNAAAPVEVREGLRQDSDAAVAQAVVLVGDTGPGGGFVFYDAGSQQSRGRYLEAAPAGWSGSEEDPRLVWCPRDQPGYDRFLKTGVDVGSGRSNTALIVKQCGSDTAAGAAAGYRGGGKDDWFLPSKEELDALYQQRAVVGALAGDYFWSSSQSSVLAYGAWSQAFGNGGQGVFSEVLDYRVRPVRAF